MLHIHQGSGALNRFASFFPCMYRWGGCSSVWRGGRQMGFCRDSSPYVPGASAAVTVLSMEPVDDLCTESIPPSDEASFTLCCCHNATALTPLYQLIPRPSHTGYCAITTNGRFTRPFFRCKLNLSHGAGREGRIAWVSCTDPPS